MVVGFLRSSNGRTGLKSPMNFLTTASSKGTNFSRAWVTMKPSMQFITGSLTFMCSAIRKDMRELS